MLPPGHPSVAEGVSPEAISLTPVTSVAERCPGTGGVPYSPSRADGRHFRPLRVASEIGTRGPAVLLATLFSSRLSRSR